MQIIILGCNTYFGFAVGISVLIVLDPGQKRFSTFYEANGK